MQSEKVKDAYASPLSKDGQLEYIESGDVIIGHYLEESALRDEKFMRPHRIDELLVLICTGGSMTLKSNFSTYTISAGSMLVVSPSSILQYESSENLELYAIAFRQGLLESINVDIQAVVPLLIKFMNNPVLEIPFNSIEDIRKSFRSMYIEFSRNVKSQYRKLIMQHVVCIMIYKVCEILASRDSISENIRTTTTKDRATRYYEKFLQLLGRNFKTERSVNFYAKQMCVTPKYLSKLIHNNTGKTAHEWIDEFVVQEIKNLLRNSGLSIQQISYQLNFPNPSFMGQYFKRITDMTPGEYKRSL